MRIAKFLILPFCLISLASAASVAHAQGSWQVLSILPTSGYPMYQTSGNAYATGSGNIVYGTGPSAGFTISAKILTTGNGGVGTNSTVSYEMSETVTYQWVGSGTPTSYFYVDVTPSGAGSFADGDGTYVRGGGSGGATAGPVSAGRGGTTTVSASASTSNYQPGSAASNPGTTHLQIFTGGAANPTLTVTATAGGGGSIISPLPASATDSYTATGSGNISVAFPSAI